MASTIEFGLKPDGFQILGWPTLKLAGHRQMMAKVGAQKLVCRFGTPMWCFFPQNNFLVAHCACVPICLGSLVPLERCDRAVASISMTPLSPVNECQLLLPFLQAFKSLPLVCNFEKGHFELRRRHFDIVGHCKAR